MEAQFKNAMGKGIYTTTTAECIKALENSIENYDAEEVFGIPREQLQKELEICRWIANTLTKRDLLMIYHMRSSGSGTTKRFADAAKQLYDANKAIDGLSALEKH